MQKEIDALKKTISKLEERQANCDVSPHDSGLRQVAAAVLACKIADLKLVLVRSQDVLGGVAK